MKKLFFLFYSYMAFGLLFSSTLEFSGYPTKIQINDNDSYYLMVNNDYDFSFYSVNIKNHELELQELTNFSKKDISDNVNYNAYKDLAEADNDLQKIITAKLEKEEKKYESDNIIVPFYVTYSFYQKRNGNVYCIFNFEDGNYIYISQILYLENSEWENRKISNENIIYFSEIRNNQYICFKYNFKKNVTTVLLIDDLRKLK